MGIFGTCMDMPESFEKFVEEYSFKDEKEYYTNGSKLVQVTRVIQAWEHYKKKEYEAGCVDGYINCINDHNDYKMTAKGLIEQIEKDISISSGSEYRCSAAGDLEVKFTADVGYISEWLEHYKQFLEMKGQI